MDADEGSKADLEPEAGASGRNAAAGVDSMEVEQGSQRCEVSLCSTFACQTALAHSVIGSPQAGNA